MFHNVQNLPKQEDVGLDLVCYNIVKILKKILKQLSNFFIIFKQFLMRDYIMVIIKLNIFEEKRNALDLLHFLFNASYENASNSVSVYFIYIQKSCKVHSVPI